MCFIKLPAAKAACSPGSAAGSGNRAAFPGVFLAVDCVSGALTCGVWSVECLFLAVRCIIYLYREPVLFGGAFALCFMALGHPNGAAAMRSNVLHTGCLLCPAGPCSTTPMDVAGSEQLAARAP
jgi:hypothetical protein